MTKVSLLFLCVMGIILMLASYLFEDAGSFKDRLFKSILVFALFDAHYK